MSRRVSAGHVSTFFSFLCGDPRPICEEDLAEDLSDPPSELVRLVQPRGGLFNERGTIEVEELP